MDLAHSWHTAWQGIGATAGGADLYQALLARYQEAHRQYHTLQHLTECLQLLEEVPDLPAHPAEVAVALWFHDAIYEVKQSDNELRSADWARQSALQQGVAADTADRLHALIMATRHSAVPTARDEQVLVDIDLAILGAPPPRFAEYEQQIRAEYAYVPDWIFRRKRREILQGFLDRPAIYSTLLFRERFEGAARANLKRAMR